MAAERRVRGEEVLEIIGIIEPSARLADELDRVIRQGVPRTTTV